MVVEVVEVVGRVIVDKLGRGVAERKLRLFVVELDLLFSWPEGIKFRFLSIPVWVSLMQRVGLGRLVMLGVVGMVMVALS